MCTLGFVLLYSSVWQLLTPDLLLQVIEPEEVTKVTGLTVPHTSHCLGSGDIMISAMGDEDGNGKGV